jgi:PilZ domain
LAHSSSSVERRRWPRLNIPVPVFVRGVDGRGNEYLDFGTAINISAGGALLASRRFLPNDAKILLELPPPPVPKAKSRARSVKAKVVNVRDSDRYHLCSLAFSKPLTLN